MQEPPDLDLQDPAAPPPAGRRRQSRGVRVIALVAVALVAGAGYWLYQRGAGPAAPAPAEVAAPAAAEERTGPLGAAAEPIDVPPLGESDEVVRRLVAALSSHPRVAEWLTTDNLIRNFTAVVENIAYGRSPAGHLEVLRPKARFARTEEGERLFIDRRSYDRYDSIADAAASVDTAGAARLYTALRPRLDEAYRELGHEEPFDRALERALVSLLRVPDVEGEVELEPQGGVYQFANPRLEQLTPPQKQLLRMGPRNVRIIQEKLREVALALGIPAERLV
jgi:hypothetical protein